MSKEELDQKRKVAAAVLQMFDKMDLSEVEALEVSVNVYGYICLLCEVPQEEALAGIAQYYKANGTSANHASH